MAAAIRSLRRRVELALGAAPPWQQHTALLVSAASMVMLLLCVVLASVSVVSRLRSSVGRGSRSGAIALDLPASRQGGLRLGGVRGAEAEATSARAPGAATPAPGPEFGWREEASVRRAAAFLIEHGCVEDAIRLLSEFSDTRAAGLAVGATVLQKARTVFARLLPLELDRLRRHWEGLSAEQRRRHRMVEVGRVGEATGEGAPPVTRDETVGRLVIDEQCPADLLLTAVSNLRRQVVATAGCPDACAFLLLESVLADHPGVRVLAQSGTDDIRPGDSEYEEAEAFFAATLERCLVVPRQLPLLERQKEVLLKAGDAEARWFRHVLVDGATAVRGLDTTDAGPARVREVWGRLPPAVRTIWAGVVSAGLRAAGLSRVPEAATERIPCLADAGRASSPAAAESFVCCHPKWRRLMRSFSYEEALGSVPSILDALQLGPVSKGVGARLADRVQEERTRLTSRDFPWAFVVRKLGASSAPWFWDGKVRDGSRPAVGVRRGKPWADIPEARVYRFFQALAGSAAAGARGPGLAASARVYGVNRGLIDPGGD